MRKINILPNPKRQRTTKPLNVVAIITLFILTILNIHPSILERSTNARGLRTTTNIKSRRLLSAAAIAGPPHVLPGTYYRVREGVKCSLILNNKGPEPLDIQPTLFNLAGMRLDVPPVTVSGTSFRTIDLREWIAAGSAFDQGSLQLLHYGMDMQLGAQIKMVDDEHSLIFDEQLMANMAMSSRLEAVWWLPSRQSTVRFALSNATDSRLLSTVSIEGFSPGQTPPLTVELGPHQTRILDAEAFRENGNGRFHTTGGISIVHNGAPGALLARGFIGEPSSGFSSVIEFGDPATAHSSKLNGGGLRLAMRPGHRLTTVIVARNISNAESLIRGSMPYTRSDGTTSQLRLPEVRLSPGEVRLIDVDRVIRAARINVDDIKSAGLEFTYSTAPGTILFTAQSVSGDSNQVFRLPLIDANAQPSSTGGYPWSIHETSSTFVYITNVTDRRQQYILQLNFQGGVYAPGLRTVRPHETATIDVRSLRDAQIKDEHNHTIPRGATDGQVQWSVEGGENLTLIGRAEQADSLKAISSSYACVNCCPASCASTWLDPGSVTGFAGDSTQFTAFQQNEDCFGNPLTPFSIGSPSWSSSNPAVASVSGGLATALSAGTTNIGAGWTAHVWDLNPNNTCTKTTIFPGPSALCDVLAVKFLLATLVAGNRSADFLINRADLSINTCNGDRFSIKGTFELPQYSDHCCNDDLTSFVTLSSDNKFEFAPSLIDGTYYDFFGNDSPPYAVVYLRKRADGGGTTSSVNIKVGGVYQNGSPYTGQGIVHLTCE